jgi:hypothetical protein
LGSILVLYHAPYAPLRRSVSDHLYSIRRYSGRPCIYINLAVRAVPAWIDRLDIDLVVLHTILLATRWQPQVLRDAVRQMGPVRRLRCPRIAIPQDEFLNTDLLVDVLRDFGVSHVYTSAGEEDWAAIYGPLLADGIGISRVLTGYLDPATVQRIEALSRRGPAREIDVGYRAWKPEPWLGRHGMLKAWIADAVQAEGPRRGLRLDISTRAEDTLLGDAWYDLLLRSRWTIGVEGGASLHDRDGSIRRRVDAYLAEHPNAPFDEVEAACFPGLDGRLHLRAISPRHLEACATRTPQILVEGSYNGILTAGRHFVPLRADLGNISEILDEVAQGHDGREMAEQAYQDVVASGRYGYDAFVRELLAPLRLSDSRSTVRRGMVTRALAAWEHAADTPSWSLVRLHQQARPIARETLHRMGLLRPAKAVRSFVRRRRDAGR